MQLLMLILMVAVLLPTPTPDSDGSAVAVGVVAGGMLLLIVACLISARLLRSSLRGDRPDMAVERAARLVRLVQWIAVGGVVAAIVGLGLLGAIRSLVGDVPLLDEAITVAPALVVIVVAWWVFHPFERTIQESVILRRLDEGTPISPIPGRAAWVMMQIRLQMLVILLPIALLALVSESIRLWFGSWPQPPGWLWYLILAGALVPIALLAPWLVMKLMGARPMSRGAIRDALEAMCDAVGVRVRDLMLWPTGGTLVNAAVTGLVSRARWVLMTDGLLETLPRPQVLAVMAHELGHARLRHMPWMALAVVSMSALFGLVVDSAADLLFTQWVATEADPRRAIRLSHAIDVGAIVVVMTSVLIVFGWVSRRFERQADAFAAVLVSRGSDGGQVENVHSTGADAMASALLGVASTNGVPPRRFSWRHGSIDSRCRHLRSLIGRSAEDLPIDREVALIKVGSVLALASSLGWWIWEMGREGVSWSS